MDKTTQSKSGTSQTMYNLHTKRTLPRDVIKWMQSLDLSYSVKDYRKDMSNGFLIGQIVSRYEPGRIPMHSFENSHNQSRRDNNWIQLQIFFSKYTLKGVDVHVSEYEKIKNNNDPKSENLYNFVCRLYSICTKRQIPQNPPMLDLPPTQAHNPNLTTSYLLKDDGLEKLQNSGVQSNNNSGLNHSGFEDKSQDRVPTRKIAPNLDTSSHVDVTGVGIKAEGRKLTSKKKSWNQNDQKEDSNSEQNAEDEKLIFDYLHEIAEECLPSQDPSLRELLFPENSRYSPTEILKRNVSSIDQQYLRTFLTQVHLSIDQLVPLILREINETWKFFVYFMRLFRGLQEGSQQFSLVYELVAEFARSCHEKEPKRLGKVFNDSLISILISEAKAATYWRKRQKIMGLAYDFSGRSTDGKKSVLSRLKDDLGSSSNLYIQWLAVLIREQAQQVPLHEAEQNRLIEDYIYYAQQYINSSNTTLRSSSLKIFLHISEVSCASVSNYFIAKVDSLRESYGDPEQVYLIVSILCNILREIVNSKDYQTLVKGVGSGNLVKAYNPDNEKNAEELKSKVSAISGCIQGLNQNCANIVVRELCAKKAIEFIGQSRDMQVIFLDYVAGTPNKEHFFSKETVEHEFKSMSALSEPINMSIVTEASNEILVEIIALKMKSEYSIESFMYLINICLENLNVKKINMEFWEDVSLHIVKSYTKLLTEVEFCKAALEGLIRVFNIYFTYDMKIRELSQWLAQSIADSCKDQQQVLGASSQQSQEQTLREEFAYVSQTITELNSWLNQEYSKARGEMVRFVISETSDLLEEAGCERLIAINV